MAKAKKRKTARKTKGNGAGRKPDLIPEAYRTVEPEWRAYKTAANELRAIHDEIEALKAEMETLGNAPPLFVRYLRGREIVSGLIALQQRVDAAQAAAATAAGVLDAAMATIDGESIAHTMSDVAAGAGLDLPPDISKALDQAKAAFATRRRRAVSKPEPLAESESESVEAAPGVDVGTKPTEIEPPAAVAT